MAIDPKPLAAEPAFGVAPALWNRFDDARIGNPRWNLRRRLEILCEVSGIDPDRARAWSIWRLAAMAVDAVGPASSGTTDTAAARAPGPRAGPQDAGPAAGGAPEGVGRLPADGRRAAEAVTTAVTVIKALQP